MGKQSGIASALYVAQYDLSTDVMSFETEALRSVLSVTSIADVAEARIPGRKDGSINHAGYWDTAAGQQHPVLSAMPTADRIVSVFIGNTVGDAAGSLTAKEITYSPTRGQDASLTITTSALANGFGLEWSGGNTGDGMLTTGLQSFATGTVNGTSIDLGATSTLFGAAAYLHCTVMPSGTASFAIQDSADNSTFANVTGMVFTNLTGPGSERVQGAVGATVRRYVRLQGTGSHGTALVACNFIRYLVSSAT